MAEPEGHTLEFLKRIQAGLADLKRGQAEHTKRFDHLDEQIDAMSGYVTWSMGKSSENRADIENILAEIDELKARLSALEGQS
jgi:septal ring factor EnvC (AmiA/AmiB activator)